ncbi:acetyl-CoA hydrolase/transferase family protein [Dasania marina]|uniref:acetyl-CoA hydrolase/transferase family protein n=1 Tax=Dasania marina TaxID=471499 RepID=UPI0003651F6E|nr:acetyl-CoA hydrolase/transferase C-terminal domain-containing protein [Dasania marina]
MPREITASDVAQCIPDNSRVFIQGGIGEPSTILQALAAANQAAKAVDYYGVSIPGINHFSPHTFHPGANFHSFFLHQNIASASDDSVFFHPLHYRDIYRFLQQQKPFDVAIIQVSPPDSKGRCSLGPSVDFVPAILDNSRCIIAECNRQLPAVQNAPTIAINDIDIVIDSDHALPSSPLSMCGDTETAIAQQVAALIDDGSCIQIGIGKLPGSILRALTNHQQLGLHSGLISEDAQALIEAGIITGEKKSIDRHQHVTGMALGSAAFYHWMAEQTQVMFRPVDYTHDQQTLAAINQFVSINSVLEIDLQGQANAERINGRAVSASGGLVDFVRGARASRGGKSILAMPATAKAGSQSRIVTQLDTNAITTLCRTDIDYVVTQYGHASLFTLGTEQRAKALVDIADPEHRDRLWHDWEASIS